MEIDGLVAQRVTAMKGLFDGIVAAFHCHDGTQLDVVGPRLATRLRVGEDAIANALMSGEHSMLGVRRLLWPRGGGVQWNPADDQCVAGALVIAGKQRPAWHTLRARLFTLTR